MQRGTQANLTVSFHRLVSNETLNCCRLYGRLSDGCLGCARLAEGEGDMDKFVQENVFPPLKKKKKVGGFLETNSLSQTCVAPFSG